MRRFVAALTSNNDDAAAGFGVSGFALPLRINKGK